MVITPSTNLKLLKVGLELDNQNQIKFTSRQSQYNFFNTQPKLEEDNFTYQRKDNIIRFPALIDDILEYNYVMYQNEAYSDKWFYAFITDMQYANDNCTFITIKTDVYQTWLFDFEFKNSFIEREHVEDDTIGLHTIKEGIEHGEYIVNDVNDGRSFSGSIIVGATLDFNHISNNKYENINGTMQGHVYNGVRYYNFTNPSYVSTLLKNVADKGQSEGIKTIFMGSSDFGTLVTGDDITYPYFQDDSNLTGSQYLNEISKEWTVISLGGTDILPPDKPTTIDGYTPKNNKLFTSEYCYLLADNNQGGTAQYQYELFSSNNCDFKFYGTLTPGMSIRLIPKNYNNQTLSYNEGLTLAKLPICSWDTDVYTNWLTQNGVNIGGIKLNAKEAGVTKGLINTVGGLGFLAAGNPLGAVTSAEGIRGIFDVMQQDYQHSLQPPQTEGNINSGDVTYTMGKSKITLYRMSIKQEFAKIIDKYMDLYGYKVNEVKIPNLSSRPYWNYIKTINCNIEGHIPQKDLQEIKNLFNNGITLWHTTGGFLNYNLDNRIVGGE